MSDDEGDDTLLAFHPVYLAQQLFELADVDLDEDRAELFARVGTTLLTLNSMVAYSTMLKMQTTATTEAERDLEDMEIKGNG